MPASWFAILRTGLLWVLALDFRPRHLAPWAHSGLGSAGGRFKIISLWVNRLPPFLSSLVGIWACKVTAHNLGVSDPGAIVWDEVVAFWLVLLVLSPADFSTQLMAFALFRFFDAAKPGPVAWADQLFKGFGWRGAFGIFFDDFVAAFCTLLCFAIWRSW